MKHRAIKDLAQLTDKELFTEVALGLERLNENASHLDETAALLWDEKRWQGSRILTGIAAEEAAKFLILIDAVRCPRRTNTKGVSRQLRYFYTHLAKGVYAECCEWRPASFGEITTCVIDELREFYLDGPNDVDWIFRNEIERRREERMYVDYVATDDGHYWTAPERDESFAIRVEPRVAVLVRAMYAIGFAHADALQTIASIWNPVQMHDSFAWSELRDLNSETVGVINGSTSSSKDQAEIIDLWPFPLHSLDLHKIPVEEDELRERQRAWRADL